MREIQDFAIRKKSQIYTALVAFGIQISIIYFAIKNFRNPVFGTNDDLIIAALLQGNFGESAYIWTYFIKPSIAIFPFGLTKLFPDFPWYVFLMIFILIILQSVFIYLLDAAAKNNFLRFMNWVAWSFLVFNTLFWSYLNPSFTFLAILISSYSVVILLTALAQGKPLVYWGFFSAISFWIGFGLRSDSLYLLIPLFVITLSALILFKQHERQHALKGSAFFWLFFVFIYFLDKAITWIFIPEKWKNYYSLQSQVSKVQPTDNRYLSENYSTLSNFFENSTWTESTLLLFKNFMLFDPNFLNTESINQLANEVSPGYFSSIFYFFTNLSSLNQIYPYLFQFRFLFLFVFIYTFFIILSTNKKILTLFFSFLIFITYIFILLFLNVSLKLPERVYLGIFFIIFIFLIFMSQLSLQNLKVNKFQMLNVIASIALWVFSLSFLLNEVKARDNFYYLQKLSSQEQNKIFKSFSSSALFVGNLSALKTSWITPYDNQILERRLKNLVILGWVNPMPAWSDQVRSKIRRDDDLTENGVYSENIYFVVQPEVSFALKDFLEEVGGYSIYKEVTYDNGDYQIIKFYRS